jgi:DNA primase
MVYSREQIKISLLQSGIEIANELESDFIVFCPFHNNYRTPAAEVHAETGRLFCFSCQTDADLIQTVMESSGRSYFESVRLIKNNDTPIDLEDEIASKLEAKPEYVPFDEELVNRLHEDALNSTRAIGYFENRNINIDSVKKFKLGFSESRDMVTIPVTAPDGLYLGFVGRSVEGKVFKNSTKLPKSKTLFNLHRTKNSSRIYIVESSFDAIRLDQVGLPAVASLGANISKIQIDLLKKYFNNIYVVADNDEAGSTMANTLIEKLGGRVAKIQLDKQYKDIGDMSDEAIRSLDVSFDTLISDMLQQNTINNI